MRTVDLQKILRFLPDVLRDDRLMFAGIEFVVMLDIPGINGVFEDAVDVRSRKFTATGLVSVSFADPRPPSLSKPVQFFRGLPRRPEFEVGFKGSSDERRLIRDDEIFFCHRIGIISYRRDAASVHPLLLRRGDLVADAFRDDFTFILSKRNQDVQHHASGRRGRVDVLRHGDEVDAFLVEEIQHIREIVQTSAQTVNLVNADNIDLPLFRVFQKAFEGGSLIKLNLLAALSLNSFIFYP